MRKVISLTGSFALGAGAMYLLDPHRGHSRRAYLRDKTVHYFRVVGRKTKIASADLEHRTRGLVAETKARLNRSEVPDEILIERVRSKLGRIVAHPKGVEISVNHGKVLLRGQVLPDEKEFLLTQIHQVL